MDWDWRFGKSPPFNNKISEKFDWGLVEMLIFCDNGCIQAVTIYSDCLYPKLIKSAHANLVRVEYTEKGIRAAMSKVRAEMENLQSPAVEFVNPWTEWIVSKL